MAILIVNDDGYTAPGIEALVKVAREFGTVFVMAPSQDLSGSSNALTLDRPLSVKKAANGFFHVNGTPTDCVHIALSEFFRDEGVDLVLSGVNDGANLGEDTLYSGTVGGATEGFVFGCFAMSFSLVGKGDGHLETACTVARDLLTDYVAGKFPEPMLLNVNVPRCAYRELKGIQITYLGRRVAPEPPSLVTSPRGQTVYWIGAAGPPCWAASGTDFFAVANGFVSVTPLKIDRTDSAKVEVLRQSFPP